MKVHVEYKFTMIASRGGSSARNLAIEAHKIASEYFGESGKGPLQVEIEIEGKPVVVGKTTEVDNMYVHVVATMEVEVGV